MFYDPDSDIFTSRIRSRKVWIRIRYYFGSGKLFRPDPWIRSTEYVYMLIILLLMFVAHSDRCGIRTWERWVNICSPQWSSSTITNKNYFSVAAPEIYVQYSITQQRDQSRSNHNRWNSVDKRENVYIYTHRQHSMKRWIDYVHWTNSTST